jgi:hypothetical protein
MQASMEKALGLDPASSIARNGQRWLLETIKHREAQQQQQQHAQRAQQEEGHARDGAHAPMHRQTGLGAGNGEGAADGDAGVGHGGAGSEGGAAAEVARGREGKDCAEESSEACAEGPRRGAYYEAVVLSLLVARSRVHLSCFLSLDCVRERGAGAALRAAAAVCVCVCAD